MHISPQARFFEPQVMRGLTTSLKKDAPEDVEAVVAVRKSRRNLKAKLLRQTPPPKNAGGNIDIEK